MDGSVTGKDQEKYPPVIVTLKNGTVVTLRPLSADDGEKPAEFYEHVPRQDFRFGRSQPRPGMQADRQAEMQLEHFTLECFVAWASRP